MKKIILITFLFLGILSLSHSVQARGRYGSFRVGGYTTHGRGSHYIGGYTRSGSAIRPRLRHR